LDPEHGKGSSVYHEILISQGVHRPGCRKHSGNWFLCGFHFRVSVLPLAYGEIHSAAPVKSRGAALIAWTGDQEFSKSTRIAAHKFGMYLDEVGLWKWHVEDKRDPEQDGEGYRERGFWQLLQSSTEEEIFERLDMESLEPERRNFKFI